MQTLDLVLVSIGTLHDDSVLYFAKVSATAHFPRSQIIPVVSTCISSETDDVTVHGMQKISHVTLTLFHSRAAQSQKERPCSATVLLDCSICLSVHLQSFSWQNMKSVKHAFFKAGFDSAASLVAARLCGPFSHSKSASITTNCQHKIQPPKQEERHSPMSACHCSLLPTKFPLPLSI